MERGNGDQGSCSQWSMPGDLPRLRSVVPHHGGPRSLIADSGSFAFGPDYVGMTSVTQ
jgi:hypothetical protein